MECGVGAMCDDAQQHAHTTERGAAANAQATPSHLYALPAACAPLWHATRRRASPLDPSARTVLFPLVWDRSDRPGGSLAGRAREDARLPAHVLGQEDPRVDGHARRGAADSDLPQRQVRAKLNRWDGQRREALNRSCRAARHTADSTADNMPRINKLYHRQVRPRRSGRTTERRRFGHSGYERYVHGQV